jgi:hypothetical protein
LNFGRSVNVKIIGGGSDQVTFNSLQTDDLEIGSGARIQGSIVAPRAKVRLREASDFEGSIAAKTIYVYENASFRYHFWVSLLSKLLLTNEIISDYNKREILLPDKFELEQNYPNPFNPVTNIRFALPEAVYVSLKIYNSRGHLVRTMISDFMDAGYHNIQWDGLNQSGMRVSTGMYFYRFKAGNFIQIRKMTLMK